MRNKIIKGCFKGSYADTAIPDEQFSEVPEHSEAHKCFWECLSHISFMDLSRGWSMGLEGRISSLGVFTEK